MDFTLTGTAAHALCKSAPVTQLASEAEMVTASSHGEADPPLCSCSAEGWWRWGLNPGGWPLHTVSLPFKDGDGGDTMRCWLRPAGPCIHDLCFPTALPGGACHVCPLLPFYR